MKSASEADLTVASLTLEAMSKRLHSRVTNVKPAATVSAAP